MDWDRFHFLCRHYQATPERLLPDDRDRLQDGELDAFGGPLHRRSLATDTLARIKALPGEKSRDLLTWYGNQDFRDQLSPPPKVRGALVYLSALTLALGSMMGTYRFVVLPRIREFYTVAEIPDAAPAYALMEQGGALFNVVVILLVLVWLFVWQVWRLYRFPAGASSRWWLRFMPGGVGRRYRELVELIRFPLADSRGEAAATGTGQALQALPGTRVRETELPRLIRRQADDLARRASLCMRLALALVGVLIVLAMGLFLVGAYSPIFATGGMV